MQEISLVFPHQLYEDHPAIHPSREVWFVEDALYFSQYKFHVQKLVLHRSSMKHCADRLLKKVTGLTTSMQFPKIPNWNLFSTMQRTRVLKSFMLRKQQIISLRED